MGMFDFLKGGKKQASKGTPTKSPSQVLKDAGLDPSDLKFGFGADGSVTITGTAFSDSERSRITSIVSEIPGISAVHNKIELAAVGAETEAADTIEVSGGGDPEPVVADPVTPAAEGKTYTVVSGDTLWKIASDQYGKGNEYMKIFEANKDILDNPDKIQVGQVLKIPE